MIHVKFLQQENNKCLLIKIGILGKSFPWTKARISHEIRLALCFTLTGDRTWDPNVNSKWPYQHYLNLSLGTSGPQLSGQGDGMWISSLEVRIPVDSI